MHEIVHSIETPHIQLRHNALIKKIGEFIVVDKNVVVEMFAFLLLFGIYTKNYQDNVLTNVYKPYFCWLTLMSRTMSKLLRRETLAISISPLCNSSLSLRGVTAAWLNDSQRGQVGGETNRSVRDEVCSALSGHMDWIPCFMITFLAQYCLWLTCHKTLS